MINIIKKNGEHQKFNAEKIRRAIRKSATRVCVELTDKEEKSVVDLVKKQLQFQETDISVDTIHNMVEVALDHINSNVAKSYREYRDNRKQFSEMLDKVYSKKLSLNFVGDRSNANSDSALTTTQKAIVYNELNSELYKKFFLTQKEERAMSDGYIYIHDRGSRLDTINCCIYDMKNLITGGFLMGNLDYQEPKSLDVAFDLIGDVTLNAASSQYGGFTIPQIDKLLAPYAQKSYEFYVNEYKTNYNQMSQALGSKKETPEDLKKIEALADEYAMKKVQRDFEQGFQSWEMKFNSVASSRGDYPFTAITFGLGTSKFETMCSSIVLKVRKNGQGKPGLKRPVLFPKLSFFYDENLHGEGKQLEWLFDEALECSMKTMYPDFISLTGDGYAPTIYKKYGVPISRMGCISKDEKVTYAWTKYLEDCEEPYTSAIGDLYDCIKSNMNFVFNKINSVVLSILDTIHDETKKEKFRKRGYVWCYGNLINQWAKDFKEFYKRKPTNGDVEDYFGKPLLPSYSRHLEDLDTNLFNLWDSYLEVKVVDALNAAGFEEKYAIEECKKDIHFIRNYKITTPAGVKQLDIYLPLMKKAIEVQDFATHSRVDNEPYSTPNSTSSSTFKLGPTKIKEKLDLLSTLGIEVIEMWEDEILAKQFKKLEQLLNCIIDSSLLIKAKDEIVSYTDNDVFELIDLDALGNSLYINDIDGKFVRVHSLIKNKNVTDWLKIKLSNNTEILVTSDHPFLTETGQLAASELFVGQTLFNYYDEPLTIESIEDPNIIADSYDVETESGTFVFSGIRSHNCRAQTSPWFERGGMEPADENDKPVYDGRFNMGAISLHFSMIAAKAKKEDKDFFEVLTYYLEMVRAIHKRTIEFLSHKKAGINPLGFCQGGFYNGNKDPDEELGLDFLKPMTISFGVIGLNEASVFVTGKPIHEDNSWAISVLKFINDYVDRIKKEDNVLYAIYGTPGESLVATQAQQFKKKYGIINGVSDKDYVTNSFHCHVSADITPVQKQDAEYPMFHLCNGGNIGYGRMRSNYNVEAFKTLTRRAMKMGFYWGNNQQLNWCEECGYEFSDSDACPSCGSSHITRVERMNGYLGLAKIRGKTFYSDTKLAEFSDRKSM